MASSVNFAQQQYFGFDPRTVPPCALWLDAADSNALVLSGSTVTTWRDKSGNARDATSVGSPVLTSGALNGLPVVTFNGLNQYMTCPLSLGTTQPLTLFVVARSTTTTGFRAAVSLNGVPGARGASLMLYLSGNGRWWFSGGNGPTDGNTNTLILSTTRFDINANYWRPSFVQMNINGTAYASSSATPTSLVANSTMIIGRAQGGIEYWSGPIAEILVYSNTLTSSQREQVEGYLAFKWGLQSNFPISHPYRRTPPAMRLFRPVDIDGGALLWLDAADPTTITGSPVTQWRDKSGRGSNATTGTGTVVAGDPINGLNTVRFGLNNRLYLTNFVMPSAQTSVFYVFKGITSNPGGGTGYFIFSRTTDNFSVFSGNEQFFSYQNPGAGRSYIAVMGPPGERNWGNLSTTAFINTTSVISTTGVSYASSNGLSLPLVGTCNVSNTVFTASTYQLSTSRSCCGDVFTYDLGELIVCDGTVSIPTAQQIEGYLAWKWGVRNSLPTTHPYYNVLPSTALFSPPNLSGLVLWMDPTDTTTLTLSGSSVTQWRDKSTTGAVFNNLFGPPSYSTTLINGLPGINLTNQCGFISASTHTLTNSLTLAMILVVKSGIDAWGSFFTHGNRDLDIALERNSISAGTSLLHFQTANDNATGDIAYTIDRAELYLGTMTTGTSRFFERFGGGTTTTVTATNSSTIVTGSKTIRIGRSDGNENCDSFIGEIVYYNRVLTTAERQELEGYLAWKWGLQASLPSTHPYAKFRP